MEASFRRHVEKVYAAEALQAVLDVYAEIAAALSGK